MRTEIGKYRKTIRDIQKLLTSDKFGKREKQEIANNLRKLKNFGFMSVNTDFIKQEILNQRYDDKIRQRVGLVFKRFPRTSVKGHGTTIYLSEEYAIKSEKGFRKIRMDISRKLGKIDKEKIKETFREHRKINRWIERMKYNRKIDFSKPEKKIVYLDDNGRKIKVTFVETTEPHTEMDILLKQYLHRELFNNSLKLKI